ncbi:hypothetical protein RchiOBHm_Chr7g0240211 [Rosa chinensis]|uniref:Uncharacterized protein n=1 Tax=Rosa chinensis TaxID=74649 RepID=A0A2P6PHZ1_ROSCH|nr:hypothetical protein RchiOBHm_Chr7g0240211 [Rosa chinensis]
MSMATSGFAEAYVMRDLHKKKLKKEEEEERARLGMARSETANSGGCFFWVMKKVHPSNPQRTNSSAQVGGTSDQ